jgi:hypothetical protein
MDYNAAGMATITEVARHWDVDRATAERILDAHDVPIGEDHGPRSVAWTDVWSIEGCGYVSAANFEAFKAPLLRVERLGVPPETCSRPGAYMRHSELKPSALRSRIARLHKPVIRLGPRTQRVRKSDLYALLQLLRVNGRGGH